MQPERRNQRTREELMARIRGEFVDMPGLRLTRVQASKLWSLRPDICDRILEFLERDGLLKRAEDDSFCRRDLGG